MTLLKAFSVIFLFVLPFCGYSQVIINEISTTSTINVGEDEIEDWVEIYNSGTAAVSLLNWGITDNPKKLAKWVFPDILLQPGQHLILLATGEESKNAGKSRLVSMRNFAAFSFKKSSSKSVSGYYLNFKISTGEEIVLSNSAGTIVDNYVLPEIQAGHSVGRVPDGAANWCFINSPTPKASNNGADCFAGYEAAPLFSLDAGFYQGFHSLTLSTANPAAEIRYTLNGSVPTRSDPLFSAAIDIDKNMTVSARVFGDANLLPSAIIKNSYFINENITLPIVSITTNPENLWNENTGIYVMGPGASSSYPYFGANFWKDWEKEAHVEFFNREKQRVASEHTGLKIHGGYSRGFDQKSFRLQFRAKYGSPSLKYPIIPARSETQSYKRLILRNGGQDFYRARMRDPMAHMLLKNSHLDVLSYEPAVVFLNGEYWGLYEIRERTDKHYLATYHDVSKDKLDILEHMGNLRIRQGSDTGFVNLHKYIVNADPGDDFFYPTIEEKLDIENFADFFIAQTFYSNYDWMGEQTGNMRLWRSREPIGRWRYFLVDVDFCFGLKNGTAPSDNTLALARKPPASNYHSRMFDQMLKNTRFRNYFINRYADLMNTALHIDSIRAMVADIKTQMEPEITRHASRWKYGQGSWFKGIEELLKYAEARIDHARMHVQNEFNLEKQVEITLNVEPPGSGFIQISTITPAEHPWTGIYFDGVPVNIKAIPAPGFMFRHWGENGLIQPGESADSLLLEFNSNESFTAFFLYTGIKENALTPFKLRIAPNPSQDIMNIEITVKEEFVFSNYTFSVFDFMGKLLEEKQLQGNREVYLSKSNYAPGVYFVRVGFGENFLTERIVFR
jgi:hypothetical protein